MKQIRERVAGLDVHRDTVVACCRVPGITAGLQDGQTVLPHDVEGARGARIVVARSGA
jgi:hypothetical protein